MTTMDRMLLSMQSMMVSQIANAFARNDDASGTNATPQLLAVPQATPVPLEPQKPSNAPVQADFAGSQTPGQVGQPQAGQMLMGLKPPMPGMLTPGLSSSAATPDLAANPTTATLLAAGTSVRPGGADAQVQQTQVLKDAGGTGERTGSTNHRQSDVPASLEGRAAETGRTDARNGAAPPVVGGGDRTDLFDGTKPTALPTARETAAERPPVDTTEHSHAVPTEIADVLDAAKFEDTVTQSASAAQQAERGGVIASFILNAGMTPGWPQPHPLVGVTDNPAAMAGRLPPDPQITEDEALIYLANLGADPALIEKVRKMLQKPPPGKKILLFLATMLTAVTVVLDALKEEFALLGEERQELEENHKRDDPRGGSGRRKRIYLE